MKAIVLVAILAAILCLASAETSSLEESASKETRTKRQVPYAFGSHPVGAIEFPLGIGLDFLNYGIGGIGGFGGIGGIGGIGGLGVGGLGPVGVLGMQNAALDYMALENNMELQMGLNNYGRFGRFNEFGPLGDVGFGRDFGGVYAGPFGGGVISQFGPSFNGPFNHPLFRGDRIKKIFDVNKRLMSSPQQKQVQARHAAEQELALEARQAKMAATDNNYGHGQGKQSSKGGYNSYQTTSKYPASSQSKPGSGGGGGKGRRGKGNYLLHKKK